MAAACDFVEAFVIEAIGIRRLHDVFATL